MARGLQQIAFAGLATIILTLAPFSVNGATGVNFTASVRCEDCKDKQDICCGDCTDEMQEDKCTCGNPWCVCTDD